MSFFINALSIRRWADRTEARSVLPQVLRRLIIATVNGLSEIDFPAHESVQRSGFDGVVVSSQGNAWVPVGRSVWELGVNKAVKSKADNDFAKRTEETPQEVQENSCFVFVTPRHWEHKTSWASNQADTGHWKEVRAYDVDDLEQWLETAPPVAVWFGG